ncbi:clostripain-related cysteine peptidase [Roseiflexus sp.]|uniref:clostripain-related cysteine peptidase n=1 Tax=Roseiflexus sp. TaxID=2562120 RepID=UPI00398A7276
MGSSIFYLTNAELRQALTPGNDNLAPIDILHLDACSMNTLELAYDLREHVDYLIAYQYVGWNSFAYYDYWQFMGENARPMDVAREIAKKYAQIQESRNRPYTVAALDLSAVLPVHNALNALSLSLTGLYNNNLTQQTQRIAQIRASSRVFDDDDKDLLNQLASMYVDLTDWAARIGDARLDPAATEQASALLNALRDGSAPLIIPQSNSYRSTTLSDDYIDLSETNGVSIFYPVYRNTPPFRSYVGNLLFTMTSQSQ